MDVSDNVAEQRRLYGAPLGELLHRVTEGLGLSQAAVARITGISPPMLSQLARGHRIKIGNPRGAGRLSSLLGLVDEVEAGLSHSAVGERLEQIAREDAGALATTRTGRTGPAPAGSDVPAAVRGVLRAVASGQELEQAARALDDVHPELARVLRAYGTGDADAARAHFETIAHLLG